MSSLRQLLVGLERRGEGAPLTLTARQSIRTDCRAQTRRSQVTGRPTGRRCTVATTSRFSAVDALLGSGSSIRQVARLYAFSRTTVGRHRAHLGPTSEPFALTPGQAGSDWPTDPLAEALALAARAPTRGRSFEVSRRSPHLRACCCPGSRTRPGRPRALGWERQSSGGRLRGDA